MGVTQIHRNNKSSSSTAFPGRASFKDFDFGEDDANVEYEISQRTAGTPIFIKAFVDHPHINIPEFESGRRYLILGQKGTGKTAVLRKLQSVVESLGGCTEFLIFRDEIASREELTKLGEVFSVHLNEVRKVHYHYYTLERMFLLILASKIKGIRESISVSEDSESAEGTNGGILSILNKVIAQPLKRIVEVSLETVSDVAASIQIDPEKIGRNFVHVDNSVLLRKLNERLLSVCVKALQKSGQTVAIFVDEIHFTYRSGHDHDQDAGLVRDLIRAVSKINRDLTRDNAKCTVYAAIRSEYLDHPLIYAAELAHVLTGFGSEISWSTFAANFEHPMFEIGARRVDVSSGAQMTGKQFMRACFANFTAEDAVDFVNSTWSKPRDMVRFLRTCREMFPNKITLSMSEYHQVFRRACQYARREVETALTSFLTIQGVEQIMNLLAKHSTASLEAGKFGTIPEFLKTLKPIAKQQTQIGSMNQPDTLFRVLYMLGAIYATKSGPRPGMTIIQSFHRNNPNPEPDSYVAVHRAIAKSFA